MPRFWASWWEPSDVEWHDITGVIAWKSGYRTKPHADPYLDGVEETSIVAMIDIADEYELRELINAHRPVSEWRFCDEREDGWKPNDRFPVPESA